MSNKPTDADETAGGLPGRDNQQEASVDKRGARKRTTTPKDFAASPKGHTAPRGDGRKPKVGTMKDQLLTVVDALLMAQAELDAYSASRDKNLERTIDRLEAILYAPKVSTAIQSEIRIVTLQITPVLCRLPPALRSEFGVAISDDGKVSFQPARSITRLRGFIASLCQPSIVRVLI